MPTIPIFWRGSTRRTAEQEVALATRILDQTHEGDVIDRAKAGFGGRHTLMLPVDLSRNTLVSYCDRLGRAYHVPPLVSDLGEDLAKLLGEDASAALVEKYAALGGRPMPGPMSEAGTAALRYRLGVGYAGSLLAWSEREKRIYEKTISPADLQLVYGDDSWTEPTVIRHAAKRTLDGNTVDVVEVYDLTNLDAPSYRVYHEDKDITAKVLGSAFSGDSYWWRYEDGVPFHPIVVTGHTRDPFRTLSLVETTLCVSMRWSAWGLGTDHASHPQRNVRGLALFGADSSGDEGNAGETGVEVGSETVLRWVDVDPEKPGDHWQDAPAFDPKTLAEAIRTYELSAMSALGLPLDYEATGGEPTEREAEALRELMAGTYGECRRFDGQRLKRAAAMARALAKRGLIEEGDYPEGPYGVSYREEIAALKPAIEEEPEDAGRPEDDGRGRPGDPDPGRDPEDEGGEQGGDE